MDPYTQLPQRHAARRCLPALLLLGGVAMAGCGALSTVDLAGPNDGTPHGKDKRRHAGRVTVSKANATIAAASKACVNSGACGSSGPMTIGRSLAGFRSYPIKMTAQGPIGRGWRGQKTHASDVITLMDRAFSTRLNLQAVHLNAYADPAVAAKTCRVATDKPCAYISQREPPWMRLSWDRFESSRAYLARNTLGAALTHFAENYVAKGKRLVIQLHAPNTSAMGTSGKHKAYQRISNVVRRVRAVDGPGKRLGDSVAFASLSRHVLELAHDQAEDMGLTHTRVHYILLTGAHFAGAARSEARCGLVATSAQVLEKSRREERKWMSQTTWLDTVWVQPRCFTTAGKEIAAVNAARSARPTPLPPLAVGIATDGWPQPRTAKWLKKTFGTKAPPAQISSLIFAIDED